MEKYYIATLKMISRIGDKTLRKLIESIGSAEKIWKAETPQLEKNGINPKALENIVEFRKKNPNAVEKLAASCEIKKIKICTIFEAGYPAILREITNAPMFFYYQGEIKPKDKRIAIIGTRDATEYGEKVAKKFSEELAESGMTIVSGAARGIDTFAHQAALKTGRTVAVLGYGLNKIPSEKQKLLKEIVEKGGVVLTEYPPDYEGNKVSFAVRDRIIAGLVEGMLVVETRAKSGTLITAEYGRAFSRKIFTIPHNIFSEKGVGCNGLIMSGANLITKAAEILEKL